MTAYSALLDAVGVIISESVKDMGKDRYYVAGWMIEDLKVAMSAFSAPRRSMSVAFNGAVSVDTDRINVTKEQAEQSAKAIRNIASE
jgi:hypothetical protein